VLAGRLCHGALVGDLLDDLRSHTKINSVRHRAH
jgi:hypothetical protein